MKSRSRRQESVLNKIDWSGSQTLRLARTLALATVVSLFVQPLASPVFAKATNDTAKSKATSSTLRRLVAENKSDEEDEDAAKKDEKAKSKEDKKAAKEKAKAADKAAKEAKDAAKAKADAEKRAEDKKKDVEKEAKKAEEKKKEEKDDEKAAKKKKGGWFGGGGRDKGDDDEVVEVEEEVVEVKPADTKKSGDAKSSTAKPAAKPAAPGFTPVDTAIEKPILLPDKALVSVLQDISKSLSDAKEEVGVETSDEKIIVGLARQILDKALGAGDFKDNRILAPENSSVAKNSMITEAWASGDVVVTDKLRGSVATVWGKRINGTLHVTIAGDCSDKTLSNGEKVGEFIVAIKGKSGVKTGFDIQSQADVTYWIGSLAGVSIESACCRLKEKTEDDKEAGDASAPAKSGDIKGDVKKKSPVILDALLTRRSLEYFRELARYQEQQQVLLAQAQAENVLEEHKHDAGTAGDEVLPTEKAKASDKDEAKTAKKSDDDDKVASKSPSKADEKVAAKNSSKSDENKIPSKVSSTDGEDKAASKRDSDKGAKRSSEDDDDEFSAKRPTSADEKDQRIAKNPQPIELKHDEPLKNKSDNDYHDKEAWDKEKIPVAQKEPTERIASSTTATPSWRDDWSKDDGSGLHENIIAPQSTIKTDTKKPPADVITPTGGGISLTRISMVPAPASASSSRAWESPAVNAAPHAPSLSALMLVPERAIAGQFVTVSVLNKDKQPERAVELSFNGATLSTDHQGQALYMIPDDMPPGRTLNIALSERPELSPRVVDILQPLDEGGDRRAPRIDRVSQLVAPDGMLVIDGHDFDGLADKNRIVVDNFYETKVTAASPVQLRVQLPTKLSPGTHTVTINNNALRSAPAKFDFIKAEIEALDLLKTKGVLSRIAVRVQGTKHPVPVRIVNRTPDVIRMSRGDNLLITTPGGNDNSSIVGVKQLKKGDYKIEATIEI